MGRKTKVYAFSLQAEYVGHGVKAPFFLCKKLSSTHRAVSVIFSAAASVDEFDPFSHSPENDVVVPHDIRHPESHDADLALFSLAHEPLSAVDGDVVQLLAAGLGDDSAELQGCTGG